MRAERLSQPARTGLGRPGATRREDRERARALGIVDELTEPGELLPRAVALATELAARSPESYRLAKVQLHRPANAAIEATAGGEVAVLAGWASDNTRLRIAAALAALARR